jgi:hypothetical protein
MKIGDRVAVVFFPEDPTYGVLQGLDDNDALVLVDGYKEPARFDKRYVEKEDTDLRKWGERF